jgi:hypothetical protein
LGIALVPTLAEIAYQGNVDFDDFIKPAQPISKVSTLNLSTIGSFVTEGPVLMKDGPCIVWDALLDFRPLRNLQLLERNARVENAWQMSSYDLFYDSLRSHNHLQVTLNPLSRS